MIHFISGTPQLLAPHGFDHVGAYRRDILLNRLGWELYTSDGLELDAFDGPQAVYVCTHDTEDRVKGVARLLPTTRPYLLETTFPQLWAGRDLPHDPGIWEMSRFAAVDFSAHASRQQQASARFASQLLREVARSAMQRGAHTLVTVCPIGLERLLLVNGFHGMRVGRPQRADNGSSNVGLVIELVQPHPRP